MADAIWYYAVDDQEKGPVTAAQLKALAGSGQLKPDDLVWREGLDDWKPAREVSGLFTSAAAKAATRTTEPTPPPAAEPASPKEPAAAPAHTKPAETPQAPEPAQQAPQAAPMIAPAPAPAAATAPIPDAGSQPSPLTGVAEPLRFGRFVGQPLLLVGLMIVLLAKGCDSIGNRYQERVSGKLALAKSKFDAQWERKLADVRSQIKSLRTDGDPGGELDVATEEEARLEAKKADELREKEQTEWRDLELAASNAESENKVWRYYREIVFVGGTILLTMGLLAVGFTGNGAQKWICLIMLAIITFSLYVGGSAWLGALTNPLN